MRLLILLLFISSPSFTIAQYHIKGIVLDSTSNEAVPFCTVYINNSKTGGITDVSGGFTLSNISQADVELVISHVGYFPQVISFKLLPNEIQVIKIMLAPQTTILNEFSFSSKKDERWWSDYEVFKRMFLGYSNNGIKCKIKNPEILNIYFDPEEQILEVTSNEFLIIENPSLGYTIKLLLENFSYNAREQYVSYVGYPYFEENKKTTNKIIKNRLKAYNGSPQHFFTALLNDSLLQEGFRLQVLYRYPNPDRPSEEELAQARKAYWAETIASKKDSLLSIMQKSRLPRIIERLDPTQIQSSEMFSKNNGNNVLRNLSFEGHRQIIYLNEKEEINYVQQSNFLSNRAPTLQTSVISALNNNVPISLQGQLINPLDILFEGYWSFEKIGEMLPLEYKPSKLD